MRSHFLGRRASLAILVVAAVALLVLLTSRVLVFIHIFTPHSGIALTQDEVNAAHNATTPDPRPQVIPKIIHQVFHNWRDPGNDTIPVDWEARRQTCVRLHPDWEYRLWTETKSQLFIATEFPWFLSTYDGYPFPVQRVDALRYFLMLHYGGIYIDLDNGCLEPLDPLLYYPVFVTDGGHGTLSNNILGARPGHAFWALVTDTLPGFGWNYGLPYVTISYASGQWFMTQMWEQYHARLGRGYGNGYGHAAADPAAEEGGGALYRVMMDMRAGAARWVFFDMGRGESWRNWDNQLFGWIGAHLLYLFLGGGVLAIAVGWCCVRCWGLYRRKGDKRGKGYVRVGEGEVELLAGDERDDV